MAGEIRKRDAAVGLDESAAADACDSIANRPDAEPFETNQVRRGCDRRIDIGRAPDNQLHGHIRRGFAGATHRSLESRGFARVDFDPYAPGAAAAAPRSAAREGEPLERAPAWRRGAVVEKAGASTAKCIHVAPRERGDAGETRHKRVRDLCRDAQFRSRARERGDDCADAGSGAVRRADAHLALDAKRAGDERQERSTAKDEVARGLELRRAPLGAGLVFESARVALRLVVRELDQAPDGAAVETVPLQAVDELLGDFDALGERHGCAETLVCPAIKGKSKQGNRRRPRRMRRAVALFPTMNADPFPSAHDAARARMVSRDIRGRGIADARVIEAFSVVPRHKFVPEAPPRDAYGDFPVPIGHRQTVSQPYIVALMVELAGIKNGDRVLEIGTGCGYQTAILAHLTPEVFTVEIIPELFERARATLASIGCTTVRPRLGDGNDGWAEWAPYDAIIVSAAPVAVPPELEQQLADGGRLVVPIGIEGETQQLMRFVRRGGRLEGERVTPVRFVPLV